MKDSEKLDKIVDDITEIKVTLAKQAEQLEHHIYRTDLAEDHIKALEDKISPIEKHVSQVSGILKFFGFVGILAGIAKACFEALSFFS
jgi:iron uptake system EfeUOB component EfeO/EfeM